MAGKRKRGEVTPTQATTQNTTPSTNGKPISAIAAARLKLEAQLQAQAPPAVDGIQEPPTSPIVEATTDYSASEFDDEIPAPTLIPKNLKLCTWRNISANILSNTPDEFAIILEKHQTVSFIGCLNVQVLKGAVNINGANIGAVPKRGGGERSWRVYVPSTHPITKIRGLDRVNHVSFVSCKEPVPLQGISPLFAGIWAAKKDMGRSFDFISESDTDPLKRPLTPENAPEDWLRAIEDITTSSSASTLVTGDSLTGKSSFAKRLLNRYLTGMGKIAKAVPSVCYLDLDPIKPEYTPHGQISLTIVREVNLGPTFTHPTTTISRGGAREARNETIAAYPLPISNLTNYEEYFISCVRSFFQTYQTLTSSPPSSDGIAFPRPPLIINTPASLYTTHFPLLTSLLTTIFKPTHIIHLGNTTAIDPDTAEKLHALTHLATTKTNSQLHELEAQTPILPPQRTEEELRSMIMQSYFHTSSINSNELGNERAMKWTQHPIETLTPWELCYQETQTRMQDFTAFLALFEPLHPSELCTALNGSVIHIFSTTTTSSSDSEIRRTPKYGIPYFPADRETRMVSPLPLLSSPQSSRLLCTALLHSFQPEEKIVNIIVPKTREAVLRTLDPEATVLVAGCCEVPEWAYVEGAHFDAGQQVRAGPVVGGGGGGGTVGPWVESAGVVEGMGYLNVSRRVRRFLG
ncbi:hypothetical protein CC80DRAFT_472017 [Byssothecium circinans]|uniref:Polynucleotide 5'-hydroxyl-kinase GRC3 n=1 Tax=Byssothecium circinans TaxID=147558 RepID=A0A6A5TWU1_9PLEO|nr:hypothetical protein CC80DRAFT_472017 [Byssothecium circinans]